MSLHFSTEKALFKVVYSFISRSDMLTVKELTKYSAVMKTTIEAEQLMKQLCNTQIEVCRALIKS